MNSGGVFLGLRDEISAVVFNKVRVAYSAVRLIIVQDDFRLGPVDEAVFFDAAA